MNCFSMVGRLGADAELKYTPAGNAMMTFRCAFEVGWGETKRTTWITWSLVGKRAEKLTEYLRKGDQVGVVGKIYMHEYTTGEGVKRSVLQGYVDNVTLIKNSGASEPTAAARSAADDDDGIPF